MRAHWKGRGAAVLPARPVVGGEVGAAEEDGVVEDAELDVLHADDLGSGGRDQLRREAQRARERHRKQRDAAIQVATMTAVHVAPTSALRHTSVVVLLSPTVPPKIFPTVSPTVSPSVSPTSGSVSRITGTERTGTLVGLASSDSKAASKVYSE